MSSDNTASNVTPEGEWEIVEPSMEFAVDGKHVAEGDVRFRSKSSMEQVRRISRISDYNMSEIQMYWENDEEKGQRRAELKQAVKDMYYDRRPSDNEFTNLGLGDKAGHGRAVRKANKMLGVNAVLDEQNLQIHEGCMDDELLADVYSITTTAAKKEGQLRAQRLHETLKSEEKK